MNSSPETWQGRDESSALAAALAGDDQAFQALVAPYARELHVHCYRLLGSIDDAEDALQETLLRAWRHLATFEQRSPFRAWLYRISTNVCLSQRSRHKPQTLTQAPSLEDATSRDDPALRLTPYPDRLLDELTASTGNPAAEYDLRESVSLAFLAAVQHLTPRQRAVLILHDVAGWSAREIAQLLDTSTASVNSALQRARGALHHRGRITLETGTTAASEFERSLVARYLDAWHARDFDRLATLFRQDVVLTMPPMGLRVDGREAAARFFADVLANLPPEHSRLIPTRANGQPALAAYRYDSSSGRMRSVGVAVLTLDGELVSEIRGFNYPALVRWFGLPEEMDVDTSSL